MPKLGSRGNGINVRALYNHVAQSYYDTWLPQYIITPLSLFNKQSTFFRKVKVYIFLKFNLKFVNLKSLCFKRVGFHIL